LPTYYCRYKVTSSTRAKATLGATMWSNERGGFDDCATWETCTYIIFPEKACLLHELRSANDASTTNQGSLTSEATVTLLRGEHPLEIRSRPQRSSHCHGQFQYTLELISRSSHGVRVQLWDCTTKDEAILTAKATLTSKHGPRRRSWRCLPINSST
jgi:hypothetical protein